MSSLQSPIFVSSYCRTILNSFIHPSELSLATRVVSEVFVLEVEKLPENTESDFDSVKGT